MNGLRVELSAAKAQEEKEALQDIVIHAQRADKLLQEEHLDACYDELGAVQRLLSRAVEQLRKAREAKAEMVRERRGK